MKTLYLDCGMGAAGDMLMASLLELLPDKEEFLDEMNGLGIPGVQVAASAAEKCGIVGTHVTVTVNGEEEESLDVHHHGEHDHEHHHEEHTHEHHHHTGMDEIVRIVSGLNVSEKVKKDVLAVYRLIAEAEGHAHGRPVEQIHFHEVGSMDAIADITGVCMLMERLAPEYVAASAVHVGSGHVHCAHGILPVPAPATAWLLQGIPSYGGEISGELCTPTGAALLKYFVNSFGKMPVIRTEKIGYGMGKKDFDAANCVRAILGESTEQLSDLPGEQREDRPAVHTADEVVELSCNLDDMTPEALGFAQEMLWEAGALDVFTTSIGMKKNRPGVMLTCLCRPEDKDAAVTCMFRYTSTLGIRQSVCARYTLTRRESQKETGYGTVRIKESEGYGIFRAKAEYEDLAKIAREQKLSLDEARKLAGG